MATTNPIAEERARRKKRPYRKSLLGCRNCKIRRVKCDETRPQCQRCRTYGVLCNYGRDVADLEVPLEGHINGPGRWSQKETVALVPPLRTTMICADGSTSLQPQLDRGCMDLLHRFKHCTLPALGNPAMIRLYENEIFRLAYFNPIVMHATLTIAAAHVRYLSGFPTGRRSLHEIYHWSQCVALFNQKLARPIEPQDQDPLWAAAASFGIISFSSVDASTPEETWPLKRSEPSDLEWLRLCEGKMVIWNLVEPLRLGSIFQSMSVEYAHMFSPIPHSGIDGIPPALSRLCNLDVSSTAEDNPYFGVVHALARLESLPRNQLTASQCLVFTRHMKQSFKTLLQKKDPIALLLTALWYRTVRQVVWWIEYRAAVECESICLYLQRYHKDTGEIQDLLPWNEKGDMGCVMPVE